MSLGKSISSFSQKTLPPNSVYDFSIKGETQPLGERKGHGFPPEAGLNPMKR